MFRNVLYWQTPITDISQDIEQLLSGAWPQEEDCSGPETVCSSGVARCKVQEVLAGFMSMSDPDFHGKGGLLSLKRTQDVSVLCIARGHISLRPAY